MTQFDIAMRDVYIGSTRWTGTAGPTNRSFTFLCRSHTGPHVTNLTCAMKQIEQLRKKLEVQRHLNDDTLQDVADKTGLILGTIMQFRGGHGSYSNPDRIGNKVRVKIAAYVGEDPEEYLR